MDNIKCLVCGGKYFRQGYYEIDVNVDIYSHAYNKVDAKSYSPNDINIDVNVDVDTDIQNEVVSQGEVTMKLEAIKKSNFFNRDDIVDLYQYSCEDCGYLMTFTKEKNVESKFEKSKRTEKERGYDWSKSGI